MNENKEMAPVVAAAPSASQRFTDVIMREFTKSTGIVNVTDHQRNLIQGYFIGCDNALRAAEEKRLKKAAKDAGNPFIVLKNKNFKKIPHNSN